MHIMLKKSAALSLALAALFVSPVMAASDVKAKTFNLQGHEKRINAYHAKMTKEGKELSKEFMNVHQGMKKGNYKYDLATARKVMQEVHAKRMPAAPHGLK
ncbi:MAG: hypothetical protein LLF94_00105 [Chlamydiales bacterium]|nr:hypothetical protein [Chlamydiales bacterium]